MIRPLPSALRRAGLLMLAILAGRPAPGTAQQGDAETGMAHLLEHLMFKGTPTHGDVMQEATERGASPTGAPGTTGRTTTRSSRLRRRTSTGR
jgi:hypothetical protein